MENNFVIGKLKIISRETDHKTRFADSMRKQPFSEKVVVQIEFDSNGNTSEITNDEIIQNIVHKIKTL